jgi:hypothetical protein
MERNNGQTLLVKPYLDNINWTKGIDPKTGKPLDYDPAKDIQTYAGPSCRTVACTIRGLGPDPPPRKNAFLIRTHPADIARRPASRRAIALPSRTVSGFRPIDMCPMLSECPPHTETSLSAKR